MSISEKFQAGDLFPLFAWPCVDGGSATPACGVDWRVLVVYRGAHCPLCTAYLHRLGALRSGFDSAALRVWALSADPLERATEQARREKWRIPVLAELRELQMRALGLYVSQPRSAAETDRNFAEPATFVINPEGRVQIVDVSNAPFARPDPDGLLSGIRFVIDNKYPVAARLAEFAPRLTLTFADESAAAQIFEIGCNRRQRCAELIRGSVGRRNRRMTNGQDSRS